MQIHLILWKKDARGLQIFLKDEHIPILPVNEDNHLDTIKLFLTESGFTFDSIELSYPFTEVVSYSVEVDYTGTVFKNISLLDSMEDLAVYPDELSTVTVFFMQKFTKPNVK